MTQWAMDKRRVRLLVFGPIGGTSGLLWWLCRQATDSPGSLPGLVRTTKRVFCCHPPLPLAPKISKLLIPY
ncbi:uncharacterized protein BDV17DRAFT_274151 [Aspergillus undulatus]|uniref:uncharacterized protein n=1 Tax=Aspergillus undulatus TaxID=1810928 RepID=UPI003CCDA056